MLFYLCSVGTNDLITGERCRTGILFCIFVLTRNIFPMSKNKIKTTGTYLNV